MAKDYNIVLNKAVDNTTNTAHISANLDLYEAARSGFFIFQPASSSDQVLKLIASKMNDFNSENAYTADSVQEALKLNVTSASVPHFEVETLSFRRGNEQVKFAGIPSFQAGKISVDDFIGLDTKSMMEAWLELTYNLKTRTGGRMYEYKMDCVLVEYTQDYRPVRTWTLYGCFISDLSEDDFNKESDGKRKISATIQYDRAIMKRGISGKASETNKVANNY